MASAGTGSDGSGSGSGTGNRRLLEVEFAGTYWGSVSINGALYKGKDLRSELYKPLLGWQLPKGANIAFSFSAANPRFLASVPCEFDLTNQGECERLSELVTRCERLSEEHLVSGLPRH